MPRRDTSWDDDRIDPMKGPKGDTAFLRDNYKFLGIGGVFRTVKARFSPAMIHAGAKRAGFIVELKDETFVLAVAGKRHSAGNVLQFWSSKGCHLLSKKH